MQYGSQSMTAPLRRVIVKRPEDAFRNRQTIEGQWRQLHYTGIPDLQQAAAEHDAFVQIIRDAGAEILCLPVDDRTGLDSIYTHDPVIMTDQGAIILQMGKAARRGEGESVADALENWDIPVLAKLEGQEFAEGGDLLWLDPHTLIAGRTFRTNDQGIAKLHSVLHPFGIQVLKVDLAYAHGPDEVLHLMSVISLLDTDLAVVYRPLLPVALYEILMERSVQLIDVPDSEYPTLGCNILALAPRELLLMEGNPVTRQALQRAGCQIKEYKGQEISMKGSGGPTCLTRPVLRQN
jgi:N-dimethylarginine dimethylaminohydrolase